MHDLSYNCVPIYHINKASWILSKPDKLYQSICITQHNTYRHIESWLHAVEGVTIIRGWAGLAITDRWRYFMGSGDVLSWKKEFDCLWLHLVASSSNQFHFIKSRQLSEGETCALPTWVPLNIKSFDVMHSWIYKVSAWQREREREMWTVSNVKKRSASLLTVWDQISKSAWAYA